MLTDNWGYNLVCSTARFEILTGPGLTISRVWRFIWLWLTLPMWHWLIMLQGLKWWGAQAAAQSLSTPLRLSQGSPPELGLPHPPPLPPTAEGQGQLLIGHDDHLMTCHPMAMSVLLVRNRGAVFWVVSFPPHLSCFPLLQKICICRVLVFLWVCLCVVSVYCRAEKLAHLLLLFTSLGWFC